MIPKSIDTISPLATSLSKYRREQFVGDVEADQLLTRDVYREPYVVPDLS